MFEAPRCLEADLPDGVERVLAITLASVSRDGSALVVVAAHTCVLYVMYMYVCTCMYVCMYVCTYVVYPSLPTVPTSHLSTGLLLALALRVATAIPGATHVAVVQHVAGSSKVHAGCVRLSLLLLWLLLCLCL